MERCAKYRLASDLRLGQYTIFVQGVPLGFADVSVGGRTVVVRVDDLRLLAQEILKESVRI